MGQAPYSGHILGESSEERRDMERGRARFALYSLLCRVEIVLTPEQGRVLYTLYFNTSIKSLLAILIRKKLIKSFPVNTDGLRKAFQ